MPNSSGRFEITSSVMRTTALHLLSFALAASFHLPPQPHRESRHALIQPTRRELFSAALLGPLAIAAKASAATVEVGGQEVVLDIKGTTATVEVGGQEVVLDFKGQEASEDFRLAKKRAIEQEKKVCGT